jgi:hypothetical protein
MKLGNFGLFGLFVNVLVVFCFLVVAGSAVTALSFHSTEKQITFKVTGKHVTHHDKTSQYRVETDSGVFTVSDSLVHGRFNSADVYAKLQPGKCYDAKVVGWRAPLISTFPEIYNPVEVRCK